MKPLTFLAAAAAEVEEAHRWYEPQRKGLGEEFLAAVETALVSISNHPEAAPIVHRDVRRLLLKRFPYGIHYRLVEGSAVVVACFHAKPHPRAWKARR